MNRVFQKRDCVHCGASFQPDRTNQTHCKDACFFGSKFKVDVGSGCWVWTRSRDRGGYGEFRLRGKRVRAHRYSWELKNGPVPEGMCVCHTCDNPSCVNPDHLFLGDQSVNMKDCSRKGRAAFGERTANAKLTEDDVRSIKLDRRTTRAIATAYGVGQSTIAGIKTGRRWAHVV